jgi:hypothetical protein
MLYKIPFQPDFLISVAIILCTPGTVKYPDNQALPQAFSRRNGGIGRGIEEELR